MSKDFDNPTPVPAMQPPMRIRVTERSVELTPQGPADLLTPAEAESERAKKSELRQKQREAIERSTTPDRITKVMDALYNTAIGQIEIQDPADNTKLVTIKVKPDVKAAETFLKYAGLDKDDKDASEDLVNLTEEEHKRIKKLQERYMRDPGKVKVVKNTAITKGPAHAEAD